MALRLTGSTLSPERPPVAADLTPRADSLLLAGDHAGYRNLFARAAENRDTHRVYQSQKALLAQGLAVAGRVAPAAARRAFASVAASALEALEAEPREPTLLNLAGVALHELWCLHGARAMFDAALRLDPRLPHVRDNLGRTAERRRAIRGRRRPLDPVSGALEARARAIAAQAKPARGRRLSLCMIVRDEEEMLPRCLSAIAPAVDEIVIVDTGSIDRTVEIAHSFGATVIEREWTGSFSDARNVSFDAATGDWIIYLDADEVLVSEDVEQLREVTGRTWREAFYLVETNFTGDIGDGSAVTHSAIRVFRNRPEYRFEGRLHEQIAQNLPGYLPERLEQTGVRVEHYGYLGKVRDSKSKSKRNIELLLAQMEESTPSPFLHFNLGSEYAASGDAEAGLAEFEKAWVMIQDDPEAGLYQFTPSLVARLVKALRACGRLEESITRADEGLQRFPGFTDLVYEQAMAALSLDRHDDAINYFERCIELGDAPARFTATVGSGTYLPRIALAEMHLNRGEVAQARELLDRCLTDAPAFFGTVLPYATALLASGIDPDEVAAEVEARVGDPSPTIRFMLGTALFERGAAAAAERQFRLVLGRQPHATRARVALGEVLLFQRRYADAAAEATLVDPEDALAPASCRTELFGLIVDGRLDRIDAALDRARAAALPDEEVQLFQSWAALVAGDAPGPPLPLGAVMPLVTIFEALLRVQDFTAFEVVVGLLDNSALPARERHEVLATVYLRRGFLASAAQEWMAVCRTGPDARALLGLARVAKAHGQPEDARVFAEQALKIEPDNDVARLLMEETPLPEAA